MPLYRDKKRKLSDDQIDQVIRLYSEGQRAADVAVQFGVTYGAVYHHLNKRGVIRHAIKRAVTSDCSNCGTQFSYNWSPARTQPRKFCSRKCKEEGYRGQLCSYTKEGKTLHSGYAYIRVHPGSISYSSTSRKRKTRVAEHIVIAEEALGRPLKQGEVVHHINCNRLDNRPSNLLVCSNAYHQWLHAEMSRRYAQEKFA